MLYSAIRVKRCLTFYHGIVPVALVPKLMKSDIQSRKQRLMYSSHLRYYKQSESTITRPSGWTPRLNNGRLVKVEKNLPGFQDAVSLMLLSKNMLFSTLGSRK